MLMLAIIVLVSAVASAFVDNIPFAATMIPIISSLSETQGVALSILAWGLAMGTDIGGSATPIGASANVVGIATAAKEGYIIKWGRYCKAMAPATLIVVVLSIAMIYAEIFLKGMAQVSKQLIISIGREHGSGGHEIAMKIAEKYGLPLYDHSILDQIAKDRGLDVKVLEEYDEKKRNMFLTRTVRGMTNSPEHSVANLQFDFLRDKAASGESFVVVGRCAEKVLAGTEGLITFFILGDKSAKTERIMKLHHMNRHDAEVFIEEKDRRRKRYHQRSL
ncbi:MAG: SLC13 family permease [Lachnospiraceae bacterium]